MLIYTFVIKWHRQKQTEKKWQRQKQTDEKPENIWKSTHRTGRMGKHGQHNRETLSQN